MRFRRRFRGITRHLAVSVLAVTLLLALQSQPGWASSGLTVAVRPAPAGAQVILSAPAPLRFTLRHLSAPDRLVVDLFGPAAGRLSGTQEIALPPVRSVRLAPGQGFVQVVIELTGPVLADVEADAGGKRLRLLLRPAAGAAGSGLMPAPPAPPSPPPAPPSPAPVSAVEVIRLQHARARDVAGHLAALLPGLVVRADEEANSLILSGPADRLAQAKALLQQMDAPSPSAPASELVRVRTADPEALARALRQAVPGLVVTADRALSVLILQGSRADVDRLTRAGLAALLREAGYVLAGEAPCAKEAVCTASRSRPLLAVVEATPGLAAALSALRAASPATRVVVFSRQDDPRVLREVLRSGAAGFAICPDGEADVLLDVLARAARGGPAVCAAGLRHLIAAYVGAPSPSPDGARSWAPKPNGEPGSGRQIARATWRPAAGRGRLAPGRIEALLTPREQEVVRVLVTGASNREIADALHLSLGTIKAHVREILSKLGVHSRAAVVREALPWIDDVSAQWQIVSR